MTDEGSRRMSKGEKALEPGTSWDPEFWAHVHAPTTLGETVTRRFAEEIIALRARLSRADAVAAADAALCDEVVLRSNHWTASGPVAPSSAYFSLPWPLIAACRAARAVAAATAAGGDGDRNVAIDRLTDAIDRMRDGKGSATVTAMLIAKLAHAVAVDAINARSSA